MTVIDERDTLQEKFGTPGKRLSHLLDVVGFKQGRGRVTAFFQYLKDTNSTTFGDLKYSTVRSWFHEHTPPAAKMDAVIDALQETYTFDKNNLSHIKTWWRAGGIYPIKEKVEFKENLVGLIKDVDSVYVGQVRLLIYQTSAEIGINLVNDMDSEIIKTIFKKVEALCEQKKLALDSKELREIIISLLRIGNEGLL